ncbi:MAG TPA: PH domain-containing protein, partial [Cytophagaceae bacterium]
TTQKNFLELKADLKESASYSNSAKMVADDLLKSLLPQEKVLAHITGYINTSKALIITTDKRLLVATYNFYTKSPVQEIPLDTIVDLSTFPDWQHCVKISLRCEKYHLTISGCDPLKARKLVETIHSKRLLY